MPTPPITPVPVEPTLIGLARSMGTVEAYVAVNQKELSQLREDIRGKVGWRSFLAIMTPLYAALGFLASWVFGQAGQPSP